MQLSFIIHYTPYMSYRHTLSLAHNIPEVPYTLHLCTLLYIHKIIITWHTTYLHTLHYITYIHFLVYNRPYIHTNDIHTWQHAWDNHVYNPGMWGQWSDSSFLCWEKRLLSVLFLGVVWLGLIWASDVRMFACHCDLTESKSRIHIWIYITNMRRNWIYIAKPRCKYRAK